MSVKFKRWLWLAAYALVLLAPLLLIMIGPRPEPREFWRELSVALGFSGLALVGVQFVPTARLRVFTELFAMDEVYYYHLRASVVGFVLIVAHPLITIYHNPFAVRLLNPLVAPPQAILGLLSLLAFCGLVITSIFRKQLDIRYETWRTIHAVCAIVAVLAAMGHIWMVDHYLAMPWQRALWLGFTVLWVGTILNTRLIKPVRMGRQPYRLTACEPDRPGVWNLDIEPDGHAGISFMPGQFVWLTFERSPFSLRQHPFSIASSSERDGPLGFTISEEGDFTSRIDEVPIGSVVYVDGPHGSFTIDRYDSAGYVFIAGGIGAVPMISMLRTLADRKSAKPAWMFYGNKREGNITYRRDLEDLAGRINLQVIHVIEEVPDGWEGETGFIDADLLNRQLPENRADLVYFVCGPPGMISAIMDALKEAGVPLERVLTEQYDMV